MTAAILIIEDDEAIRDLMHVILSQAGYSVVWAASGQAGLEVLRRTRVELVLLDVNMPRMSGIDVLAAMKRIGRPAPPVLMVTADSNMATVSKAVELGCTGYVTKPFTPAGLLGRVRRALDGQAA